MPRDRDDVAYLRVADILRADIASGRIAPGGRLPSETQLMIRHHVPRSVARWAIAVLEADGLIDCRSGAQVFVRSPQRLIRRPQRPGVPPCDLPPSEANVIRTWTVKKRPLEALGSVGTEWSAVPVKPPRWNFAGVCICCGANGCVDQGCASWYAVSAWMVCPLCHGVQQLPDDSTCWMCLFGVVEAE